MAFSLKESSSCSFTNSSERYDSSESMLTNLYKTDRKCVRCDGKFGLSMQIYKKKYWCKFCRRGVCSECSPQRLPNPTTMKYDRICTLCYQRVMANHFKKGFDEDISKLKAQIEEFNYLYGQEVKRRVGKTAKKKNLERILEILEKESEAKDRDLRIKIAKLKTKKENLIAKMNLIVKKFQESQREREKKEKRIKELENEEQSLKERLMVNEELWNKMKELREKKIKLMKKCQLVLNLGGSKEAESYEQLLASRNEIAEENKQLLEDLSQITADLEIKELKIKNLQKKISEISLIFQSENENESENQEIKQKILEQSEKIKALKDQLLLVDKSKEEITSKPCSNCLIY